jgi:hypothetical protein
MPKKRVKFAPIMVAMKRRQATLAKPTCTMTKDLTRLMAEVQLLREQVQKAEAGRVLH